MTDIEAMWLIGGFLFLVLCVIFVVTWFMQWRDIDG